VALSPQILEALEPEPAAAGTVLGDRLDAVRAFTHNLAQHGEELGLIGPLELPRLWTRHILNSALLGPLLRPGLVGDIGSGAGLPGLVLALQRPDVQFVLVEPMERRTDWLSSQAREMGLENVEVRRARAEESGLEGQLDQVTARAVSAFKKLLALTAPLVRDGGELVLLKGANAQAEIDAAVREIKKYRVKDVRVELLGEGVVAEPTRALLGTVR
jgi:16S rRNA (guanine527-N7)-methyltransferase